MTKEESENKKRTPSPSLHSHILKFLYTLFFVNSQVVKYGVDCRILRTKAGKHYMLTF